MTHLEREPVALAVAVLAEVLAAGERLLAAVAAVADLEELPEGEDLELVEPEEEAGERRLQEVPAEALEQEQEALAAVEDLEVIGEAPEEALVALELAALVALVVGAELGQELADLELVLAGLELLEDLDLAPVVQGMELVGLEEQAADSALAQLEQEALDSEQELLVLVVEEEAGLTTGVLELVEPEELEPVVQLAQEAGERLLLEQEEEQEEVGVLPQLEVVQEDLILELEVQVLEVLVVGWVASILEVVVEEEAQQQVAIGALEPAEQQEEEEEVDWAVLILGVETQWEVVAVAVVLVAGTLVATLAVEWVEEWAEIMPVEWETFGTWGWEAVCRTPATTIP